MTEKLRKGLVNNQTFAEENYKVSINRGRFYFCNGRWHYQIGISCTMRTQKGGQTMKQKSSKVIKELIRSWRIMGLGYRRTVGKTLPFLFTPFWCLCVFSHIAILQLSEHQLGVLQFNSVLTLTTRDSNRSCKQGLNPTRPCSTPHVRHQSQVQVVTYASDWLAPNWEFHDPLLRFDNLLERLTELRKENDIVDDQFILKENNSETARQKRCIRKGT